MVLFWLGTGSIKGFALTPGIGVLVSMFSSLFVTKLFVQTSLRFINLPKRVLMGGIGMINFIKKRRLWYAFSIVVIGIGIISMAMNYKVMNHVFNWELILLVAHPLPFDLISRPKTWSNN